MDILQDTFIQVFTRLKQFRGDSPFWGWLRRVAVNTCLGRMRKDRRVELTTIDDLHAVHSETPDQQMDLAHAFSQLPEDTRAVVWLYDVEGFTHAEIAGFFGKSISFSKTQLHRAHAAMRDMLESPGSGRDSTASETATADAFGHGHLQLCRESE